MRQLIEFAAQPHMVKLDVMANKLKIFANKENKCPIPRDLLQCIPSRALFDHESHHYILTLASEKDAEILLYTVKEYKRNFGGLFRSHSTFTNQLHQSKESLKESLSHSTDNAVQESRNEDESSGTESIKRMDIEGGDNIVNDVNESSGTGQGDDVVDDHVTTLRLNRQIARETIVN